MNAVTTQSPDMLGQLRAATAPAHARLDAAFGALDLRQEEGCRRFLAAHAIALRALFPRFARFVQDELSSPCPDYPAMLAQDLAERGCEADALPLLDAPAPAMAGDAAAGMAYVIAGSRLGNAVIRRNGYAGRETGRPSRYMEDDAGHALWKALVPWLRARAFPPRQRERCEAAALATFTAFEHAHALSAAMNTPCHKARKGIPTNG